MVGTKATKISRSGARTGAWQAVEGERLEEGIHYNKCYNSIIKKVLKQKGEGINSASTSRVSMEKSLHMCKYGYKAFHQLTYGIKLSIFFSFPFFFFFFLLFRAATVAYGGSKVRSQTEAAAVSLQHSHSNARSEPIL